MTFPSHVVTEPEFDAPSAKMTRDEVTEAGDDSHVPLSVTVYSESAEAAARAWRGKRGYWWYHGEYARAQGT